MEKMSIHLLTLRQSRPTISNDIIFITHTVLLLKLFYQSNCNGREQQLCGVESMCLRRKGKNCKGMARSSFIILFSLKFINFHYPYVFITKCLYSPSSNTIEAWERQVTYPVTTQSIIWEAVGMFGLGFCFPGYLKCIKLEVLLPEP